MNLVQKIIDGLLTAKEEESAEQDPVDECRVSIVDGSLRVTHIREISVALAAIVNERRHSVLEEIRAINPTIVDLSLLPVKREKNVKCSTLTVSVDISHNSVDEINELSLMVTCMHERVLSALNRDIVLVNITKDMKPYINGQG